jgi:hypothetical protein
MERDWLAKFMRKKRLRKCTQVSTLSHSPFTISLIKIVDAISSGKGAYLLEQVTLMIV